jgi:hypothetical protein
MYREVMNGGAEVVAPKVIVAPDTRKPSMFKLRTFIGVALVAGVAAGVWLADFWKGFGWGGGPGLGSGSPESVATETSAPAEQRPDEPAEDPTSSARTLRVVIRDRSYFLKHALGERLISLEELVAAVKQVSGDDDGIRLRVYRAESSRPTAELQLEEALRAAGIPDSATYWSPDIAR